MGAYAEQAVSVLANEAHLSASSTLSAFAGVQASLSTQRATVKAHDAHIKAKKVSMRSSQSMRLDAVEEVTVDSQNLKFGGGAGRIRLSSTPLTSRVTIETADTTTDTKQFEQEFVGQLSSLLGVPKHRLR